MTLPTRQTELTLWSLSERGTSFLWVSYDYHSNSLERDRTWAHTSNTNTYNIVQNIYWWGNRGHVWVGLQCVCILYIKKKRQHLIFKQSINKLTYWENDLRVGICVLPCHELLRGLPFSQMSEMCLASGILSLHEWDRPLDLHTHTHTDGMDRKWSVQRHSSKLLQITKCCSAPAALVETKETLKPSQQMATLWAM